MSHGHQRVRTVEVVAVAVVVVVEGEAVVRGPVFATVDNSVELPGYSRVDAAVFVSLSASLRLQLNVENVFDREYWTNADSNTNLSPGSPRAARLGLTARL